VVDKVALGNVSSEHFGFSCHFSFSSSGAATTDQLVADVPNGLSECHEIKKKIQKNYITSYEWRMHQRCSRQKIVFKLVDRCVWTLERGISRQGGAKLQPCKSRCIFCFNHLTSDESLACLFLSALRCCARSVSRGFGVSRWAPQAWGPAHRN
jgi:hypothetical protein